MVGLTWIFFKLNMTDCLHINKFTNLAGETIEEPYKNIFCPDCGVRLVHDYKAEAFKLRG